MIQVALFAMAFLLAGCAATVKQTESAKPALTTNAMSGQKLVLFVKGSPQIARSRDWDDFRGEWREAMTSAAATAGVPFVFVDQEPESHPDAATLVVIDINDYRYVSAGSRILFGVMTGNAYIEANAQYYELPQKRPLGERRYNTTSTAWQGIFSAMTSKQVAAICAEILSELARPLKS